MSPGERPHLKINFLIAKSRGGDHPESASYGRIRWPQLRLLVSATAPNESLFASHRSWARGVRIRAWTGTWTGRRRRKKPLLAGLGRFRAESGLGLADRTLHSRHIIFGC